MKPLFIVASLFLFACAAEPLTNPATRSLQEQLHSIERHSGGRLGVAVLDGEGRLLGGLRTDERFAFCSTFKLLLAGMVLEGVGDGNWSLDEELPLARSDLVFHSPITEQHADEGSISIGQAVRAIMTVSDNAAANLLLKRLGGIGAFNFWLKKRGDSATRLDRFEPSLNENRAGDVRDTTTPMAIGKTASNLLFGGGLPPAQRNVLREWLVASETGRDRVRAGLPSQMIAGDKTGTCGAKSRESYNDVAFVIPSSTAKRGYVLAVFLDRPTGGPEAANAAIARVARSVAPMLRP